MQLVADFERNTISDRARRLENFEEDRAREHAEHVSMMKRKAQEHEEYWAQRKQREDKRRKGDRVQRLEALAHDDEHYARCEILIKTFLANGYPPIEPPPAPICIADLPIVSLPTETKIQPEFNTDNEFTATTTATTTEEEEEEEEVSTILDHKFYTTLDTTNKASDTTMNDTTPQIATFPTKTKIRRNTTDTTDTHKVTKTLILPTTTSNNYYDNIDHKIVQTEYDEIVFEECEDVKESGRQTLPCQIRTLPDRIYKRD